MCSYGALIILVDDPDHVCGEYLSVSKRVRNAATSEEQSSIQEWRGRSRLGCWKGESSVSCPFVDLARSGEGKGWRNVGRSAVALETAGLTGD